MAAGVALLIATVAILSKSLTPPPDEQTYRLLANQLSADNLPIEPDRLLACEMDRPSCIGEGRLLQPLDEFRIVSSDDQGLLVRTGENDLAKVKLLESGRVRFLTGTGLEEHEANAIFSQVMATGRGRHEPYDKP